MNASVKVFSHATGLAQWMVSHFLSLLKRHPVNKPFCLALSGGTTPLLFYRLLSEQFRENSIPDQLSKVLVFWVDERCVPPNHPDSNFGAASGSLIESGLFKPEQVFRIIGENDPGEEALRYAKLICHAVPMKADGVPEFDWVLLGVGEDGHTASIFPDRPDLLATPLLCEVSRHPATKQIRVTLTGRVLMHAKHMTYLATGSKKAQVVKDILEGRPGAVHLPAFHIRPVSGNPEWILDADCAQLLSAR